MTSPRRRDRGVLRFLAFAFTVAAIVKELRLPREHRTWHGSVAGLVPYDFRPPDLGRIRRRMWAPESPHVLTPAVFGVGWTVNVGRLVTLARNTRR